MPAAAAAAAGHMKHHCTLFYPTATCISLAPLIAGCVYSINIRFFHVCKWLTAIIEVSAVALTIEVSGL